MLKGKVPAAEVAARRDAHSRRRARQLPHKVEAPIFDLGTVPAGNLFTTADDLAKFASMLPGRRQVPTASKSSAHARRLAQMWGRRNSSRATAALG